MKTSYILIITFTIIFFNTVRAQNQENIQINSSNKELVKTFNWAKEKALSFVQTEKTGPVNISERKRTSTDSAKYIPSYWAGYPLRTAFYSRDFCHQIIGAHLLGLEKENYSMMKAFAASANVSRKWYPLWAINFDGSPYALDYQSDDFFVREVPAVFELVEKVYQLYLWTGDETYLTNDTIYNFCKKAVSNFVELHDTQFPNGVAEGTGKGIFKGAATFNEQHDVPLIEAGDGIACQYQAFKAFAKMARKRGQVQLFKEYIQKTIKLWEYFNNDWGTKNTTTYNRGYSINNEPVDGWGKENSWFIPMKEISDSESERHWKYLDFINERLESKDDIPENIEAISYVPEVFFTHHQNETGWKWMKHIISKINQKHIQENLTGRNGDYPEVSYVLISNIIENLLGISPDAPKNYVSTLSHLPAEINFLGAKNITIGSSKIEVNHSSQTETMVKYSKGTEPLIWEACFYGDFDELYVDGKKVQSQTRTDNGKEISFVSITLKPGSFYTVSTTN